MRVSNRSLKYSLTEDEVRSRVWTNWGIERILEYGLQEVSKDCYMDERENKTNPL